MAAAATADAIDTGERDRWVAELGELIGEIAGWARDAGWDVDVTTVRREEADLGEYDAPALRLGRPGGRVYVTPVARRIMGGQGRVDLEAFPGLTRLALVRRGGRWRLRTDHGVDWPRPWSKRTLAEVLDALARAA